MPNLKRLRTTRTPLFKSLRQLMTLAHIANGKNTPPVGELVELRREAGMNRRQFLKMAGAATAVAGTTGLWTSCATKPAGAAPRIAIVGAGVAGLNAAYKLRKAGIYADVYEASKRTGGRMFTGKNLFGPGLTTELGGEFIDTGHEEMLKLAKEFRLDLIDVQGKSESKLIAETCFFDGQHRTEEQVVEAFRSIATKIKEDQDGLEDIIDFEHPGGAEELDKLSLAEYLDKIGASGWMRELLEVAFVTEYGGDPGEQSSLNMLSMISPDISKGQLTLLGDSDERYKIRGGNQLITDELARRVADQIKFEQRLTAITSRDKGFTLTFDGPGAKEVEADFVIMTIPFTMLRQVDLRVELPDFKKKAITELGYGQNAKVMLGYNKRVWRERGFGGNIYSDELFQLGWDSSRLQAGDAASFTLYSGGREAMEVGTGTAAEQAARLRPGIEKAFPGMSAAYTGKAERFHWPTYPFSQAAYACYKPGQWTTIAGAEIKPVGNLFFAGEHCSSDFQGFMNGGAETGKEAAQAILKATRKRWMFGS